MAKWDGLVVGGDSEWRGGRQREGEERREEGEKGKNEHC